MSQRLNRDVMEAELGTKVDGVVVVPKPQNREPSRSENTEASRFCFICLRHGETTPPITDAHVFNRSQRGEWPPPFAAWSDNLRKWAIFSTGVVINSKKKLFIGGRWDELQRLFVPVCEECRQMEQVPDRIAQRAEIVRGISGGEVTIAGFPPNTRAVVRAGDTVTIEDWRPLAEEVVKLKTQYFLDAFTVAVGSPPRDFRWWRQFLEQHPARQPLIRGLRRDYVASVRITSEDGAERWGRRVLRPKPKGEHSAKRTETGKKRRV